MSRSIKKIFVNAQNFSSTRFGGKQKSIVKDDWQFPLGRTE
jgi:hypothetical protein